MGLRKAPLPALSARHRERIESANGGTLFLDEIGDMPLDAAGEVAADSCRKERLSALVAVLKYPVDVRVVCATNQNLGESISAAGEFREDLYYRISEITINIPPVRERDGERILLARHLLAYIAKSTGTESARFFRRCTGLLLIPIPWPGNVREMENKIKSAVIMAEGKFVTAADLGLSVKETTDFNLRAVRQNAETRAIRAALIRASDNVSKTAELLGVTRPTLYDLMQKYHIRSD